MKVLKFGGTSVGSVKNLQRIKDILTIEKDDKIVVCSAMSGVTDILVKLTQYARLKDDEGVNTITSQLETKHREVIDSLIKDESVKMELYDHLSFMINEIFDLCHRQFSESIEAQIVTYGETLLTYIFSGYLNAEGVVNTLVPAKDFMFVENTDSPNINLVAQRFKKILKSEEPSLIITQGFVCRDHLGQISTLKRGGSDYTATIIGAAVNASEVQIWTDIDGLHNNDPRYVDDTNPIAHLTYNEAAELAYFGAKILHPQTVSPVVDKDIPVLLKNTFDPGATGTVISDRVHQKGLKAISAKDNITAIKIKSNRMLMAHGYLKQIFEVFDRYATSIDMITTSEIAISLTIDNTEFLDQIVAEIETYAEITVEEQYSIICIVGESVIKDQKSYKLFEILNHISVRMISYGGSDNNISLLVPTKDKIATLRFLNKKLFQKEKETVL
ncbi:aspartate kinase [Aquimarina sp. ERC-38]|uniref:aspartate kinase n=1 Tax=Aquimarina sp. ERC-38 TaxID=2949996 RepID=UPI002245A65D|nr:aspartate kinase [Aquimarina sp. ERC-38]UZO79782.1 aspartate kinase [Aquimarina sp. ERC-38]